MLPCSKTFSIRFTTHTARANEKVNWEVDTYDDAVTAGHRGATALAARTDTDDRDGAAVEADCHVDVLQDDAEQSEEGSTCSRVRLHYGIKSQDRVQNNSEGVQ